MVLITKFTVSSRISGVVFLATAHNLLQFEININPMIADVTPTRRHHRKSSCHPFQILVGYNVAMAPLPYADASNDWQFRDLYHFIYHIYQNHQRKIGCQDVTLPPELLHLFRKYSLQHQFSHSKIFGEAGLYVLKILQFFYLTVGNYRKFQQIFRKKNYKNQPDTTEVIIRSKIQTQSIKN